MFNNDISQAKIKTTALMTESFYTDFMPMIQQIKKDISSLNIGESDKKAVFRINEQLIKAENLLKQLKTVSNNVVKND